VAAVLGKESKVADALFKLAEVKEVHVIPGRHDIMAVVEVLESSWSLTPKVSTGSLLTVSRP